MPTTRLEQIARDLNPLWAGRALPEKIVPNNHRRLFDHLLRQLTTLGDRRAIVLVGPRQVGKTTLLLQLNANLASQVPAANITYFAFDDHRIPRTGISPREVARISPPSRDPSAPVFLLFDEIANAQRWASWLKQTVDREQWRIIVTDSSAGMLRRGGRESGVGRWDEYTLEPMDFQEFVDLQVSPSLSSKDILLGPPDPFESYLQRGGFPEHILSESYAEIRRRIRDDVLERTVNRDLVRSGVREVDKLTDLLGYLLENSGSKLNARKRSASLSVDARTVRTWIAKLLDTRLLIKLNCKTGGPASRLKAKSRPKLYAIDHSLVSAMSPDANPLASPACKSRIFETVVFRHLREICKEADGDLAFFPEHHTGSEVDFILDHPKGTRVIEVTTSERYRDKIDNLLRAGEALHSEHLYLVHGGYSANRIEDVTTIPLHEFLRNPSKTLGL